MKKDLHDCNIATDVFDDESCIHCCTNQNPNQEY